MGRLSGKVVVVRASDAPAAARAAADGAAVVVVGADAAEVGAMVGSLRAAAARACGFVGGEDPASRDVADMAAELFPGLEVVVA